MDIQKLAFIVGENHNKGYEIKETETALEAWGLTEEEKAQKQKEQQIAVLKSELADIDAKSIRPARAIQTGTSTQDDIDRLAELESQAEEKRQQIKDLQGE